MFDFDIAIVLSIASFILSITSLFISIKQSHKQNKIALYDKRKILFDMFCKIIKELQWDILKIINQDDENINYEEPSIDIDILLSTQSFLFDDSFLPIFKNWEDKFGKQWRRVAEIKKEYKNGGLLNIVKNCGISVHDLFNLFEELSNSRKNLVEIFKPQLNPKI